MAYTLEAPIQTIIYPFAEFSPEYQAILWAKENKVECRFCDLPSSVFLAIQNKGENPSEESLNSYIHRKIDEFSEEKIVTVKSFGKELWNRQPIIRHIVVELETMEQI